MGKIKIEKEFRTSTKASIQSNILHIKNIFRKRQNGKKLIEKANNIINQSNRFYSDEEPILATDAVRLVDENVDNDAAVLLLGHALKIKAERKLSLSFLTIFQHDFLVNGI